MLSIEISRLADASAGAAAFEAAIRSRGGRVSSFEVVVDGMLAYSKIATGSFPDFKGLASEIATFASTGAVPKTWAKPASA